MSTTKEIEKTNRELAQFKAAIGKIRFENENAYNVEKIFQMSDSSDKKVLPTNYLISNHPEWIGDTALSIVLRECNVFNILLNKKIEDISPYDDYDNQSIDEYDNQSIDEYEEFVEKSIPISNIVREQYENLNIFSDPRFKLPNSLIKSMLNLYKKSENLANLVKDKNGISQFHVACMVNHTEVVEFYLNSKITIDHAVNSDSPYFPGYTPLHFAVKCCSVQTVQLLLQHNANLHLKDANGMTALQILLKNYVEFTDVAQQRIATKYEPQDCGSDSSPRPKKNQSFRSSDDCYAEDYLKLKCKKMIKLFLEKYRQKKKLFIDGSGLSYFHLVGAIGDISLATSKSYAHINHCISMNSPLWPGYSPLHFVALLNDNNTIKKFIKKGWDIAVKDVEEIAPIDIWIGRYSVEDVYEVLSVHPILKNIVFSDGKTRLLDLIFALQQDECAVKKFLKKLPKNTDIYIPYDSPLWPGFSLIHVVVAFSIDNSNVPEFSYSPYEDILELVSTIFHWDPKSLHARNSCVSTPLDFAFRRNNGYGNGEVVDKLLSLHKGLSCDVQDNQLSCLHIACSSSSHVSLIEKLLASGNNVNSVYKGKPFGIVNTGWTPLHFATANNRASVIKLLAQHGANIFAKDINGMTPIHLLLIFNNGVVGNDGDYYDCLLSLANYEDAVADAIGLSHLHVACFRGNLVAIEKLIKRGADINRAINYKPEDNLKSTILNRLIKFDGSTPLDLALRKNKETVELLLQLGADVFMKSCEYGEPLICAILKNRHEDIGDLDKLYLSILARSEELQKRIEEKIGLTKLHIACRLIDVKLVQELLDAGAEVNAQIHMNSPIWPGYAPLHTLDYGKRRDLPVSAQVQQILKLLLNKNADVTLSNAQGKTPLHMAYEHCNSLSEHDNCSYVNVLLQAQQDFRVNPKSIEGLTHFHIFCSFNDISSVKKFLTLAKIDVNQRVDDFIVNDRNDIAYWAGCTPLHLAVSKRAPGRRVKMQDHIDKFDVVDCLLNCGADVNIKDVYGNSALHRAANNDQNCQDVLERLKKAGADLNSPNIF